MNITPNVLATRYATKEMVAIFDPVNKIINERKFWITILKLQQKAGLPITASDIASYEKVIEKVDLASIDKREMKTRHDVKARIEEFNALAGVEKIHIGLTSRDLTENIELIQIKAGLELIEHRVLQILFLLNEKISKYEKTYMVGRSHNVAAQVTTLGKRFASCAEELLFAHSALKELTARLPLRGIKGPVGTSQDALDAMGNDFANLEKSIGKEFGFENTGLKDPQLTGIRFATVAVPANAEIVSAYLEFTVDATSKNQDPAVWYIKAEDNVNSVTFPGTNNCVSSRAMMSDSVTWNVAAGGTWNTVGSHGAEQLSPDLKDLVKALVDKNGWVSGNPMTFFIKGTGCREVESFDGDAAKAPLLVITYASNQCLENATSSLQISLIIFPSSAICAWTLGNSFSSGSTKTSIIRGLKDPKD